MCMMAKNGEANAIYGNYTTVQPSSLEVMKIIKY